MEEGFEGWYSDPYGRHEARWMSDGRPTKLVRDDGVEAYDDPPDEAPSQTPTRIDVEVAPGSGDLRRADDPGGTGDLASLTDRMNDAALEGGAHPEIDLS